MQGFINWSGVTPEWPSVVSGSLTQLESGHLFQHVVISSSVDILSSSVGS